MTSSAVLVLVREQTGAGTYLTTPTRATFYDGMGNLTAVKKSAVITLARQLPVAER